jgi:S1-C subfamily serine protease
LIKPSKFNAFSGSFVLFDQHCFERQGLRLLRWSSMKNHLWLFMAFLLASCSNCSSSVSKDPKHPTSLAQQAMSDTVALVWFKHPHPDALDEDSKDTVNPNYFDVKVYCSGVWVGKDSILTANHCVEGIAENLEVEADSVKIHYIVGDEVSNISEEPYGIHLGQVIARDTEHDLALIRAFGDKAIPAHGIAVVASESPGIGEELTIVGHPRGFYFTSIHASVSQYRKDLPGAPISGPWLQVEGPVWFGNSGGGAFDDSGHLVGIASLITSMAPNVAFFVHCNSIQKFLNAHLI